MINLCEKWDSRELYTGEVKNKIRKPLLREGEMYDIIRHSPF